MRSWAVAPSPSVDQAVRLLRRAGCVAAEEEAAELWEAAGRAPGRMAALVGRRVTGEPLAWITGRIRFCGADIRVHPGVYVPRWQTEPLARRAAHLLPARGRAVDLCTGSGAVAAVLCRQVPDAAVIGTDLSPPAVTCARVNGVDARLGSLDEPLPPDWESSVDVLTAVAPYVPTEALHLLDRDSRRFEPRGALDGGAGGTRLLAEIVRRAGRWLAPGTGRLLLELGAGQEDALAGLLAHCGFGDLSVLRDEEGDVRGIEAVLGRSAGPDTAR